MFNQPTITLDYRKTDKVSLWGHILIPVLISVSLIITNIFFPDFQSKWLVDETSWNNGQLGLIEILQAAFLAAAMFIALKTAFLPQAKQLPLMKPWLFLATLCCFYVCGEEVSWGQHLFNWATPDGWVEVNDQQETNLHNTSSWFDQKPRIMLEIGVVLGGIILPLIGLKRTKIWQKWFSPYLPALSLIWIAILAEIAKISTSLGKSVSRDLELFYRGSEINELYFYYFVLAYVLLLHKRLKSLPTKA